MEVLKPTVGLRIEDKGLTDSVSFSEAGFIPWEEIEEVFIDKMSGKDHLIIKMVEDYQINETSKFHRKPLVRKTRDKFGNAIAINKEYIQGDLKAIASRINEALKS